MNLPSMEYGSTPTPPVPKRLNYRESFTFFTLVCKRKFNSLCFQLVMVDGGWGSPIIRYSR